MFLLTYSGSIPSFPKGHPLIHKMNLCDFVVSCGLGQQHII